MNQNSIYTAFFTQYAAPPHPSSPINVGFRFQTELHIKPNKNRMPTLSRGRGEEEERYLKLKNSLKNHEQNTRKITAFVGGAICDKISC